MKTIEIPNRNRFINLTGKKFGYLTVISLNGFTKHRNCLWNCLCECGNMKVICAGNLRSKHSISCGCYSSKVTSKVKTKHGLYGHYIYSLWTNIKGRCHCASNRAYKNYGGRGIKVHEEWKDNFSGFYTYVKEKLGDRPSPKHSMDRIDNNGHYEPGNLRWATSSQQAYNRRPKEQLAKFNKGEADGES